MTSNNMLRALNPNQNTIDLLLSIENKQKKEFHYL